MPAERVDVLVLQRIIVQLMTVVLAGYAIIQGAGIIVGGRARWEGNPALEPALASPGAPTSWGVALAGFGVLLCVGMRWSPMLVRWAAYGICVWSVFFVGVLLLAVIDSPKSSTTGPGTYGFIAVTAACLAVAYRKPHRR